MNANHVIATLIIAIVTALVGPYYVSHPPGSNAETWKQFQQARHFSAGLDSSTIHAMQENHVNGF